MVEDNGAGLVKITAKLSVVDMIIRYSELQKLRIILQLNLGDIDEASWENVERDAERMLADGARRVRYGKPEKRENQVRS